MKKITTLIILPILLTIIGCSDEQVILKPEPKPDEDSKISQEDLNWQYSYQPQWRSSSTFIVYYVSPKQLRAGFISLKYRPPLYENSVPPEMEDLQWSIMTYETDSVGISCHFSMESTGSQIDSPEIHPLDGRNTHLFNAIASANGDHGYNGSYWDNNTYLYSPTKDINITCTTDYDTNHPAGTLLNDITVVTYYTAAPFIKSKYQNRRLGDYIKSRTTEPLVEFNKKNVNLLRSDMIFRLITPPSKKGSYQFALTYCNKDGATLSATTVPINLLPN